MAQCKGVVKVGHSNNQSNGSFCDNLVQNPYFLGTNWIPL